MSPSLFRRRANRRLIDRLHGGIVAAARQPEFYISYGVADTFEGRFEMVTLHTALVLRRLRHAEMPGPDLAQDLVDRAFASFDTALREAGIGDLSVPKRMKKLAEAFFGRATAYDEALADAGDDLLVQALARNVFGAPKAQATHLDGAHRLAAYVRLAARSIGGLSVADLAQGRVSFPEAATI
jgi:cytochrome b pre-mRNA-processing protein 3